MTSTNGRWMVQTETSAYVLDLDRMTCLRYPGLGTHQHDAHPALYASELRKDGNAIPLISVEHLEVGESMVLVLDLRGDGVMTVRATTVVQACERVDA